MSRQAVLMGFAPVSTFKFLDDELRGSEMPSIVVARCGLLFAAVECCEQPVAQACEPVSSVGVALHVSSPVELLRMLG